MNEAQRKLYYEGGGIIIATFGDDENVILKESYDFFDICIFSSGEGFLLPKGRFNKDDAIKLALSLV